MTEAEQFEHAGGTLIELSGSTTTTTSSSSSDCEDDAIPNAQEEK